MPIDCPDEPATYSLPKKTRYPNFRGLRSWPARIGPDTQTTSVTGVEESDSGHMQGRLGEGTDRRQRNPFRNPLLRDNHWGRGQPHQAHTGCAARSYIPERQAGQGRDC